jgi:membrane protein required for colicin V production
MVAYDVIMLIIIVAAAFRGWQKGMAWQIASLGSIVLSYFVAVQFRVPVSEMISLEPPLNRIAAVLVLFLATSFVVWLVFQSVKQSIDRWKLKDFDRQMGALVGVAKGILLAGLVTLFAVSLLGETQGQAIVGSKSGYTITKILQRANAIIPEEVQHVLRPYMERLEGVAEQVPPMDDSIVPWLEDAAKEFGLSQGANYVPGLNGSTSGAPLPSGGYSPIAPSATPTFPSDSYPSSNPYSPTPYVDPSTTPGGVRYQPPSNTPWQGQNPGATQQR